MHHLIKARTALVHVRMAMVGPWVQVASPVAARRILTMRAMV